MTSERCFGQLPIEVGRRGRAGAGSDGQAGATRILGLDGEQPLRGRYGVGPGGPASNCEVSLLRSTQWVSA